MNNPRFFFFFCLVFVFVVPLRHSMAYETVHLVRPNTNFDAIAMNHTCSTLANFSKAVACNPALFIYNDTQSLNLYMAGKADGPSIENNKKLIFKKIDEDYIRSLFEDYNYNSFTMNSSFDFYTPYFILSYSPYYLLMDFLISNPAFPQISLILVKRRTIKLTSGLDLAKLIGLKKVTIGLGVNIFNYTQRYINTSFSLIRLGTTHINNLIFFEKQKETLLDLGTYISLNDYKYVPQLSVQVKNLGTKHKVSRDKIDSVAHLETRHIFEKYSSVGVGYNFLFWWGAFYSGINYTFDELFTQREEYPTFAARYSLGLFSIFGSMAEYSKTAGMSFSSSNSNIGILYSYEKEIKRYNIDERHSIYLNVELKMQ